MLIEAATGTALRDVALAAGYDGPVADEARRRRQELPARDAVPPCEEPLRTLIQLFAAGDIVPRAAAERLLDVDDLIHTGLLEADGDHVRSRVRMTCLDDLMLLGDFRETADREFVAPAYVPSQLTAVLLPRDRRRSMLDLGTGSGVLALLAASRVVGVDINPRALDFAERNARLNGITNAQWRLGSWLEPVAGERFDLITCNPPYALSPDHDFTYRDSGLAPGELVGRLCRDIPQHLEDDGLAVMLAMWPHADERDWDLTPRAWARASGCDTTVICLETVDALDDAVRWNSPPTQNVAPEERARTIARWHRFHTAHGTGSVSFGIIVLRRTRLKPWSVITRGAAEPGPNAHRQLARLIAGNDHLRDPRPATYAVPDGFSVTQRFVRNTDGWIERRATIGTTGELGLTASVDPAALDALFGDNPPGIPELLAHGLVSVNGPGKD